MMKRRSVLFAAAAAALSPFLPKLAPRRPKFVKPIQELKPTLPCTHPSTWGRAECIAFAYCPQAVVTEKMALGFQRCNELRVREGLMRAARWLDSFGLERDGKPFPPGLAARDFIKSFPWPEVEQALLEISADPACAWRIDVGSFENVRRMFVYEDRWFGEWEARRVEA